MTSRLPLHNSAILKSLLGKKIVSVKRQLFQGDMDLPEYEQNADGPVELKFSDGAVMHFIADTEKISIGIVLGEMPIYGDSYVFQDLSTNVFWLGRIDQEITKFTLFKSSDYSYEYPSEFGIEISFSDGKRALIEYKDEEDYPDMVVVADHYSGKACIKQSIY